MVNKQDLLLELGCEELPAKNMQAYAVNLAQLLQQECDKQKLTYGAIKTFATPRRLAVFIADLDIKQNDFIHERKGPALSNAFDADGKATNAAIGFARSNNVTVEQLEQSEQGFLIFRQTIPGKETANLIPELCENAINKLAIQKPMRWNNHSFEFIRPVHWLVLLLGSEVIKTTIFDLTSDRITYGHRFHQPQAIAITSAKDYAAQLFNTGKVIADFEQRRALIQQQILQQAEQLNATAIIDAALLDEVTGIVEWPIALTANFSADFLKVPAEALISAMNTHQKSFPVVAADGKLLPHFITIANIESNDPQQVIIGNQRVMQARLSDAAFFYESDLKQPLEQRLTALNNVIFQAKLGTLFDKSKRVAQLAAIIAETIADKDQAYRAGLLAKADLNSDMVKEFPELQGIMGYYYATHDGENKLVAEAIRDHYLPRFAGDNVGTNSVAHCVALADRIDTLVGIFGINQLPTGDKDPFALRRAALAVLRIFIENNYALNLKTLLQTAVAQYQNLLANPEVITQLQTFILERLRAWYQDQNIVADTLSAVLEGTQGIDIPLDIHHRVLAVHEFRALADAKALTQANKRAANILIKSNELKTTDLDLATLEIKTDLFEHASEKALYEAITKVPQKNSTSNYNDLLTSLAELRAPVDEFFDNVMVFCDDEKIRNNRLALLFTLRKLFLRVADISKLQE